MRAVWGLMCAVLCCFVRDTAAVIGKLIYSQVINYFTCAKPRTDIMKGTKVLTLGAGR